MWDSTGPLPLSLALPLTRRGREHYKLQKRADVPSYHARHGSDSSLICDEEAVLKSARDTEILAHTFVEYQKDRTWEEVCGERQFIERGQDLTMSGRYVPLAERADPELVRVNDLNGDFELIQIPGSDYGHL